MKTFLALLISCLTLSAATTYPVLTDSTNRIFPGGVTNVFFLNSNIVTTGTMRATGAVTLTNSGNVFAGDGSGLTGISAGISTSGGNATNLSIYSSGTTNRPLRVFATNGTTEAYFDHHGRMTLGEFGASGSWLTVYGDVLIYRGSQTALSSAFGYFYGGSSGFQLNGPLPFGWHDGSGATVSMDTTIRRSSAGVVEVSGSSSGAFRDLVARSVFVTNLYATNLIMNGGATVTKILSATATLNFDLTALTVEDLTITVTGAADGDVVTLGVPNGSITTSVQYSAWVSAADTVTVRARTAAVGENPASGVFRATVIKH